MTRLTMGAVLGGLAVYLFDPEMGEERRERLSSLWNENRGSAVHAGLAVSHAAESARPLARRMTKAVGRSDWAKAFDRGRPAVRLPTIVIAAAIGGTLIYFLDPVTGSKRRERLLLAWKEKRHTTLKAVRQAARQTAKAVRPQVGRVNDQVADGVVGVKSEVR